MQFNSRKLFDKILIANRGEIACRVIETCRKLGIKTVAVYSDADKTAKHVEMSDEAFHIGESPSQQSYLRTDKILKVLKESGAQAIHPGYGFLSENAEFADLLAREKVEFIGPPAQSMRDMGSKSASKLIMEKANVPCVPGYHGENQDPQYIKQKASEMGYPIMIKAVLGGGGKGMRIVRDEAEFDEMLESSKGESLKSFNDDRVLIEKYIERPRHIEVQVFADKHGNVVYLYERDCSVQRRHQKVLEEAPAPSLDDSTRKELGERAVAAAKAVNYVGAGTVEFIMDTDTNKFYFMEMNTRLQVEHPVTEMITNLDLVQWQIEVACGRPLPLTQEEIPCIGHAIEARIYAENTSNGFLPDSGKLVYFSTPQSAPDCRVETGVRQHDQVSVFYDPMIAKLIVKAPNRETALRKMQRALEQFHIAGVHSNVDFLHRIVSHKEFQGGKLDTSFISKHKNELFQDADNIEESVVQVAIFLSQKNKPTEFDSDFRLNTLFSKKLNFFDQKGNSITAEVRKTDEYSVSVNSQSPISVEFQISENQIKSRINGKKLVSTIILNGNDVYLFNNTRSMIFSLPVEQTEGEVNSDHSVKSPMSCKIVRVNVVEGQKVTAGMPLLVLEAMKMEHVIKAPYDGTVEKIFYKKDDIVPEKKILVDVSRSDQ